MLRQLEMIKESIIIKITNLINTEMWSNKAKRLKLMRRRKNITKKKKYKRRRKLLNSSNKLSRKRSSRKRPLILSILKLTNLKTTKKTLKKPKNSITLKWKENQFLSKLKNQWNNNNLSQFKLNLSQSKQSKPSQRLLKNKLLRSNNLRNNKMMDGLQSVKREEDENDQHM